MLKNQLRSRKLGLSLSYLNTALNMICGLLTSALLLRLLGDVEYGLYKTMTSFANMLVMFEFGTGTVMTRNISLCKSRDENNDELNKNISTIWGITVILSFVILVCSIFFYCKIDVIYVNSLTEQQILYGKKIFVLAVLYLITSFIIQTVNGIILAYDYYSFSSIMNIVNIVSRTLLLLIVLKNHNYAISVCLIDLGIVLIIMILSVTFCKKNCLVKLTCKFFDKDIFISTLPLCFAIFLQTIVNQMNNNVDNFLIGIKLNPESVSLYSVALYVYTVFSSATTIPISLYAPQIIRDVGKGMSGQSLTKTLVGPSRLIVLVGGSIMFGFIAAGHEFIEIVYGKEYAEAWIIALIIMIPMFINMTSGVLVNVLDALNKRMARSNVLIITTVLNLFLTLIWLDKGGIIGAACATAVSTIIGQIIIMHVYYSKKIGIKVFYLFKETYKGIVPFQIVGAIVAIVGKNIFNSVYVSFFIAMVIYILISLGGFLLIGNTEEEKSMVKSLLGQVKKW